MKVNNRVMLINSSSLRNQYTSPENYFPLGLLSIATVLKKNDIDAAVIDINNDFYERDFNEELLDAYITSKVYEYIKNYKPAVIGIGSVFSGAFKCLKIIAKSIKNKFPKIPIVIGGIHATIFAREILEKYEYIDYVVIGEGEYSFLELLNNIFDGRQSQGSVDGIAFRSNSGVQLNPKNKFINNLDELPFINYDILNINEYKMDSSGWYSPKNLKLGQPFPIISSRSCPERCTFCSMWLVHGPRIRFRSATNVLDEIEHLYNRYNTRVFHFMDDNMTFSKKRTLEICNGIVKRNINIQFDTPNGLAVKRLDHETIDALVEAGLTRMSIAIESGSDFIRNKIIKKRLENEKIYEIVESCARHRQLFIQAFFVIGFPQETSKTLDETYEMIEKLPLDKLGIFYATPYPGTLLYKYCLGHNLLDGTADALVDVEHLQHLSDKPHFKPPRLTIEHLVHFRKKCYDFLEAKRRASSLPDNYPLRLEKFTSEGLNEYRKVKEYSV